MTNTKRTLTQDILDFLFENGSIDDWQAREEFGTKRLSDVICRLRKKGHDILSIDHVVTTRYGKKVKVTDRYILIQEDEYEDEGPDLYREWKDDQLIVEAEREVG